MQNVLKGIKVPQIAAPSINSGPKVVPHKGLAWFAGRFLFFVVAIILLGVVIDISQQDMMKAAMFFAAISGTVGTVSFLTAKEIDTKIIALLLAVVFWCGFLAFAIG